MKLNNRLRFQLFMQNSMFVVLFLTLVGLLGFVSYEYHYGKDITQGNRNTLTQGSVDILKQMKDPVNVTVYVSRDDAYRKAINDFVSRYQRAKPDFRVKYVNPSEEPKQAQEAGVRADGEFVVEYQKRSEHLVPPIIEQDMTNALVRLSRSEKRTVMYLDGHGERSLIGEKNHDIGAFGKQLESKGFKLSNPDLTIAPDVPKKAAMLVIAGPQVDVPEVEVNKIRKYVEAGGNLLWLIDEESLHGLQPLAEQLGLVLTPGVVVDLSSKDYGADIKVAFSNQYAQHPITNSMVSLRTLFPLARQIDANSPDGTWNITRLLDVAPNGWLETDKLDGKVSFNDKRDIRGPINIAVAMERKLEGKNQRVVVVGNGDFLANTFVTNGGNLDLGVNMINWLAGDDRLITIQPKPLKDVNVIIPSDAKNYILAWTIFRGSQYLVPIALLVIGIVIWLKRRKG